MTDTTRLRKTLSDVAARPLPVPGCGQTAERLAGLAEIAFDDLELARLAEAHHDAQAIAAELGFELCKDATYGVWAASGTDPLTAVRADVGYRLTGTAPWCTGVGVVDRALVTARQGPHPDAPGLLLDVAVRDGTVVESTRPWASPAFADTATASVRFRTTVSSAALVGSPGEYLARPGFWHGAVCVSACWAGGLAGLVDRFTRTWKRTDPHSLAHLGSATAWSAILPAVLRDAGDAIDADPSDAVAAEMRARSIRHVVERTCITVIDELTVGAGPEPLAFDADVLQRVQQLQLYIRQCHGERDLEPLGAWARELPSHNERKPGPSS